jgi:hypothetical protein
MAISAPSPTVGQSSKHWWVWFALTLLWTAAIYFGVIPWFRPRGSYLWGHYRIRNICTGTLLGITALCATAVLLVPARYRRPLAFRCIVMLSTVLVMVLVTDLAYTLGVMRAWQADYWLDKAHIPRRYSLPDRELEFVRRPGIAWQGRLPGNNQLIHYRTDEHGFRNRPGLHRAELVFIGDSYTEAAQVTEPDTFVQRVAAASRLSAVNLGRGAYGPQQECIVLRRYGLAYLPRVVFWQCFEGNDLNDAHNFALWQQTGSQSTKALLSRLLDNSLIHQWLSMTLLPPPVTPVATLRYTDQTEQAIALRYRYQPQQPEELGLGMEETLKAVETGFRLCQDHGIRLVLVFIPSMVRVMEPWLVFDDAAQRERYLPGNTVKARRDFPSQLQQLCQQLGCPYLDALPALRSQAARDNQRLYIPNDEHLDVMGHQVIAQLLLEWLRVNLLSAS